MEDSVCGRVWEGDMANQPQEESLEYQSKSQKARTSGGCKSGRDGLALNSRLP